MYVRNISGKDLIISIKGQSIIVKPDVDQYIPDCLVTKEEVEQMYGPDVLIVLDSSTAPREFTGPNQQVIKTGKLYLTATSAPWVAKLYIGGDNPVNVYGSDSIKEPKYFSEMDCPETCQDVIGINYFDTVPKYIAVEGVASTELVVTNLKCFEVGNIR